MAQRPTLKDVSAEAGVSTFTVSQALAGKPGVADETRTRILAVANNLGYVPNGVAASLKGRSTPTIGVMTASGRNQYYSMLVQSIDGVLQQHNLHAVTNDAMRGGQYDAALEKESVDALLSQRVAAIVATYSLNSASLKTIEQWGIPLVFVDALPPATSARYPFVGADNYGASEAVANYLANLGHRECALVGFPSEWTTRTPRELGFTETATQRGMRTVIIESDNSSEGAFSAMRNFFHSRRNDLPDAVYALNTPLLHGSLRALRELNISIPDELSVVSFDDFEWADLLSPGITVVDQHIQEIGRNAGRLIVDILSTGLPTSEQIVVQPDLIIRSSCGPRSR